MSRVRRWMAIAPICGAAMVLASCGGTKALPFPVPAVDGDLVVIFVSADASVDDAVIYVQGEPPQSISVGDGQRIHAAVLTKEQLVDAAGQMLDVSVLRGATVSWRSQEGDCGRCVRGPFDAPWSVVDGESCAVPPYAAIGSEIAEAEVRQLLQSVFISWPGDCACTPPTRIMNPSPLDWSYVDSDAPPLSHVAGTSSSTMLVGLQRAEHHGAGAATMILPQEALPFDGPVNGLLRLSNGDFLVASAPVLQSEARDTLYRFAPGAGGSVFEHRSGQDFALFGTPGDPALKVARLHRLSSRSTLILGTDGNSTPAIARRGQAFDAPLELWIGRSQGAVPSSTSLGSAILDADQLSDGRLIFMGQKGFAVTSTFAEGTVPTVFAFAHSDAAGPGGRRVAALAPTPNGQNVVGCLQGIDGATLVLANVVFEPLELELRSTLLAADAFCAGFSSVTNQPDSVRAAFSDGTSVVVGGDGMLQGGLQMTELEGVATLGSPVTSLWDDEQGASFARTRSGAVYAHYLGTSVFVLVKAGLTDNFGGIVDFVSRSSDVVAIYGIAVRVLGGPAQVLIDPAVRIQAAAWDPNTAQIIVAHSSGTTTRLGVLDPTAGTITAFGPDLGSAVRRIGVVGPGRTVALGTDGCIFVVSGEQKLPVSIESDDPSTNGDVPFDFTADCAAPNQSQDVFSGLAVTPGTAWIGGAQDMLLRLETWSSPLVARRYSLQRDDRRGAVSPLQSLRAMAASCPDDLTVVSPLDPLGSAFGIRTGDCIEPRFGLCQSTLETVASATSPGSPVDMDCAAGRCVAAHQRALRSIGANEGLDARWFDGFLGRVAANPAGGFVAGDTAGRLLQSN